MLSISNGMASIRNILGRGGWTTEDILRKDMHVREKSSVGRWKNVSKESG